MARRKKPYYRIRITKVRPGQEDEWNETYHVHPRKDGPAKITVFPSKKKRQDQLLISVGGVPQISCN